MQIILLGFRIQRVRLSIQLTEIRLHNLLTGTVPEYWATVSATPEDWLTFQFDVESCWANALSECRVFAVFTFEIELR